MKARNREVNIFNMSLLDILCGALGAFCFLMLALFPYYKPSHLSAEDQQTYQDAQQMQQKLQQLERQLQQQGSGGNPQLTRQLQTAIEHARQQLAQNQEQLNRTRAAMEQAQSEAARARSMADHQSEQLMMKHPLVVQEWWTGPAQKVDLFIHDPGKGSKGETAPEFDPSKEQGNFFTGTQILMGPGSQSWVIGDTLPGSFKVYYHLVGISKDPVTVQGAFEFESHFGRMPEVTLSTSHASIQVGSIVVEKTLQAEFVPTVDLSQAAKPGSP